jgi:hypothetical protein
MPFSSARNTRERILLFGGANAGKTTAVLQIARVIQDDGAHMYLLDTEDGSARLLEQEFSDLRNIEVHRVYDWPTYQEAADAVMSKAKAGDWIAVDLLSMAWDAVQRYFVSEVFGKNRGDYFLHIRREMQKIVEAQKSKNGKVNMRVLDGWRDWGVINAMYKDFVNPLLYQTPAHLVACSSVSVLSEDEDGDVRRMFSAGYRPAGQKDLPHQFDTIIFIEPPHDPERKRRLATTYKDRGRQPFTDQLLVNFPLQYLMQRAGWRNES